MNPAEQTQRHQASLKPGGWAGRLVAGEPRIALAFVVVVTAFYLVTAAGNLGETDDAYAFAYRAEHFGLDHLSDPRLWHQAKQEISPIQAPLFGDLVARQLAAIRGLSKKCLVLDLDNTIWGGVIGDDGLEGIALGQGDPLGEAFAAFQGYAKRLSERGVILAVASKNDPEIAKGAFEQHPEMILKLDDIAAFEATWFDKPASLQRIATELGWSAASTPSTLPRAGGCGGSSTGRAIVRSTGSSISSPATAGPSRPISSISPTARRRAPI